MMPNFRAYINERVGMVWVRRICFYPPFIDFEWENEVGVTQMYSEDLDKVELMQSAGLKDKNGVEIFEGDILPSDCNVFSKGELNVQVVRFLGGGFRRLSVYQEWGSYGAYGEAKIADWHDGRCLSEEDARKTKVLGNIYENPELLEVAE